MICFSNKTDRQTETSTNCRHADSQTFTSVQYNTVQNTTGCSK